MKKIMYIIAGLLFSVACKDNFEELNKNPYQITNESLRQDFNDVGGYFPTLLKNIFRASDNPTADFQVDNNLASESFVRHLATPTPFMGNINNTTYRISWNTVWDQIYKDIMAPSNQVIKLAKEKKDVMFENLAKLIRIVVASRLTAHYGPIIYSDYGSSKATIKYDSEQKLYTTFFKELDEILAIFKKNQDYKKFEKFDTSYNGSVPKWIKLVNSLRLRLAIRLAKANPTLAKAEGEKALSDAGGLIEINDDNFNISLYGIEIAESIICFSWNDTRMSATMESVLVGYEDPRIAKFFDPVSKDITADKYSDHPKYPYKGIRNGATLTKKDLRIPYSTINEKYFKNAKNRSVLAASEVLFLKAEAALRNWSGSGNAKGNYENAVKRSFEQWDASGADTYLNDDTKLPIDYKDPVAPSGVDNNFTNRIKVTVKWDNADTNEVKLEKIITQKWIALFTNSTEAWVDHRRTGYPKLPYNARNDSNADYGVIAKDDFIRRMPFINREIDTNPDGVKDAVTSIKGNIKNGGIQTRLYFDTDNLKKTTPVNF